MKNDTVLGLIGVAIGLPSFILLFAQGQSALAIIIILFILCLLWYRYDVSQPDFKLLEIRKKLSLLDSRGERAKLNHYVKLKANRKGISEYCFKGISVDGTIDQNTIFINGQLPEFKKELVHQLRICKRFPPLQRGEIIELTLEIEINDSFTNSEEVWVHNVVAPTDIINLEIEFPRNRCPISHYSAIGASGSGEASEKFASPIRSSDGRRLFLTILKPKMGREYQVYWTW